ncbi:hypothetical protein NE237_019664 [Protea cynaroides]|uniref:Sulfhydryl oxidase n=1 Tax=Protea cynaroides TaxID=273540 RepID=A0A9Q0H9Q5_9MAGN|nr:hypothetical protein NE237_019664 [Protea cynaroides]
MSPILLLLLLLLSSFQASCVSVGSRSILRELSNPDIPDAAADLNSTNFDEVLRNSPASFSIVEFFSHWCPVCRNYKPHYEKVARLFSGPHAAHPGVIFIARVDCELKLNTKLCDRFSVDRYPMLLWGSPSKFASGGWEPGQDKSEICIIDDGRTADSLLNWINKQLGSSYDLDDEKYEYEHLPQNTSDLGQIVRAIYDVEEATSNAFQIIFNHKMIKSETRAPLIRFLQVLVAHHPSRRCRKGSAEILVNFGDLWPSNLWSVTKQEAVISHGKDALKSFRICGKAVPRGYWIFCQGSRQESTGYSCGLWVLLHSLSVRVEDVESQVTFTAICDFIHKFSICQDCHQHFYKMCSSVSSPFNKMRDLALWLWTTHNTINERLMVEEASLGTGNQKFPKIIWPSKELCPTCYLSMSTKSNGSILIDWNKDQVFNFLVGYYGKMLESSYKDEDLIRDDGSSGSLVDDGATTTNAVAVPVGAALAIAAASCAFGALACFWRSRQKKRKFLSHLHPLKNI